MKAKRPLIVVLTGPESTGKSTLAKELGVHFKSPWIAEYARDYVAALDRPYTYEDVEKIALEQKRSYEAAIESNDDLVIFDTFLIITKVWFMELYQKLPDWFEDFIKSVEIDMHIMCYPDIKWVKDEVRENEHQRKYLFERYKKELENYKFTFETISGEGEARFLQAKHHINQLLKVK